jgi:hypothetical protein
MAARVMSEIADSLNNRFSTHEWPEWKRLTFDTNGEIILLSSGSPFSRQPRRCSRPHSAFIHPFIHIVRKSVFS